MSKEQEGKHTPGPWFAIQHPEWKNALYLITNDKDSCWASYGGICYVDRNNANLIAKAPEMYEEIEQLKDQIAEFEKLRDDLAGKDKVIAELEVEVKKYKELSSAQEVAFNFEKHKQFLGEE